MGEGLGDKLAALARGAGGILRELSSGLTDGAEATDSRNRLREIEGFGSNPGDLRMLAYVPGELAPAHALVVVLHGCGHAAYDYDYGAGWSVLADRYGFALLFPEQRRFNNPQRCFNWFQPDDARRDAGEALSIRQMISRMVADHRLDPGQTFITGLSAGGAMTAVMLATYPEVFAGGAIIAGLPYGAASNTREALKAMFQGVVRPARAWGDLVRNASGHRGPWPRISVWHGAADATVNPINAGEIVKQWTDLHGIAREPGAEDVVDGHPRRVWRDAAGREVVESYTIAGMAHGTPLGLSGPAEDRHGHPGPFLLDVGIASSYQIARFWGLTGARVRARPQAPRAADPARAQAGWAPHRPRAPVQVGSALAKAIRWLRKT